MIRYYVAKLGYGLLVLLGVSILLSFIFFAFLNKDDKAIYEMIGQNTSQAEIERIKKELYLHHPISVQVVIYLNDLLPLSIHSSDTSQMLFFNPTDYQGFKLISVYQSYGIYLKTPYLRRSYQNRIKVEKLLIQTLPNTAVLALASMLIASLGGIILGIIASLNYGKWIDRLLLFISTLGMSFPSFFVAIIVSWLFGFVWHEITGLSPWGNLYEIDDYTGEKKLAINNLILPAFTLGIRPLSVIMQLSRNNLYEVLQSDYIRTSRAKGLSAKNIIIKHALKNTLNPVLTAVSGWLGSLLAGAVFVEYVFGWKGIGRELVNALQKLDYPVVMGCILTIASMFVLINILVDFMYGLLDPRIRK
ncbi:MAG: ABC transporter permease [Flavobacteriales bacterium]|nr:ABC transporter permease [Flavobacteriales bacterium]